MRPFALTVVLALLALPAQATSALLGIWDIEVTGGTANGDIGVIVIREGEDGQLIGELEYVDADADVMATEICAVREEGDLISITCRVLTPDSPFYYPDDFSLRRAGPNRLEGRLHSATSGPAVFIRREVPMS